MNNDDEKWKDDAGRQVPLSTVYEQLMKSLDKQLYEVHTGILMWWTLLFTVLCSWFIYAIMSKPEPIAPAIPIEEEVEEIISPVIELPSAIEEPLENQIAMNELTCLAENIYFEARSETNKGKEAVAWVTLNRLMSSRYPDTICKVVKQANKNSKGQLKRHQCQFSWYCDGLPDKIYNVEAFAEATIIAYNTINLYKLKNDPTKKADHYHTKYVNPKWSDATKITAKIDSHIFFKLDDI